MANILRIDSIIIYHFNLKHTSVNFIHLKFSSLFNSLVVLTEIFDENYISAQLVRRDKPLNAPQNGIAKNNR